MQEGNECREDMHDEPRSGEDRARAGVADGKGILAADETLPTLTRRFDALRIKSTEQSRRDYREMLFAASGTAASIGGAIVYDETIRQKSSGGAPIAKILESKGVLPGIKVLGAKLLAGSPDERVSEVLDCAWLSEYRAIGPASQSGGRSFM
jgi:fructose-bisphosphate aldolase class I